MTITHGLSVSDVSSQLVTVINFLPILAVSNSQLLSPDIGCDNEMQL